MAEDESDQESERLVEELEAIVDEELTGIEVGERRCREYCRRFCEIVEDYTARWHVPLPQLQVLQTALCCFTSASVSFPDECEHVQYVLSRLALSLFELMLFFGKDEFYETPLKDILGSVQECHDLLMRYDNIDLRLATCVIKDGGPWEDPVLQAILKGKSEPQDIVDKYLESENQLFFEFRVRYLIACERISEAVALITTCLSHPEVSRNIYYHQAYFICLHMTKLTDKLLPEHVLRMDTSDGVSIICRIEKEGKTALALQLSEAFLITQLQTGKMYCVWELIFIWSKLQLKVNPSKEVYVEQCYNMLRIAANVKVIFPFMKTIRDEVGEAGVQLSVELCGCALQLDLHNNPETKSLIYKTIAYLFPTDLEICRICALSVFFLERTVESYKDVERLYKYSDEDYNEFNSYVENRVRFELLPILKRGLLFDPEFWNFQMIEQNCAELLGEKAALVTDTQEQSDNPLEPNLPPDDSVMQLRNGVLKLKERSCKLRLPFHSRRNHTIPSPKQMEHNVPKHPCILCKKEFLGGHIFRHAQTHHEGGFFTCVLCARKFRNKINMLRHLKHHLKKMQRHSMVKSADASSDNAMQVCSDIGEVNSSESLVVLENGSSTSSTSEELNILHSQETEMQCMVPDENHLTDHNIELLHHSTATQTSFSTDVSNTDDVSAALGEIEAVEEKSDKAFTECIKLNGSVFDKGEPDVSHKVNYQCPAKGCHRVFQRVRALNKHARKSHPSDENVQQHIMAWNKGKCRFCQRKFTNGRHFMDHLKRHTYPNVYFCQQQSCNKNFKFVTHLAEHQLSHETLIFQCGFINCTEVFEQISSLYEHEARHYEQNAGEVGNALPVEEPVSPVPVCSLPQEDMENNQRLTESTKKVQTVSDEVVDLPVPTWKSRKEVVEPKTYKQTEKKMNGEVQTAEQTLQPSCNDSEPTNADSCQETVQETPSVVEEQIPNGYIVQEQTVSEEVDTPVTLDGTRETATDITLHSDTAQDVEQKNIAVENRLEDSKPNQPAKSAPGGTRLYSRPLPPSYLDEQYISMPKRRKSSQDRFHENPCESKTSVEKLRCGKCLTNYCSSEALDEHLAQKKCQLYFGFDSDDESAW
ncbi:zinc finger protein 654 isoform X1 [Rana temporaria]|uniref:zinc finger protein 654 isoform X1 n=1 Tax=Rana temporaria TaxID=8407 RepID=UPI001AADB0B2|nr:zinc finger protein 654 isoform X1 [Rana temporaria]